MSVLYKIVKLDLALFSMVVNINPNHKHYAKVYKF